MTASGLSALDQKVVEAAVDKTIKQALVQKLQKLLPLFAGVVQEHMHAVLAISAFPSPPGFLGKLMSICEDHGITLEGYKIEPSAVFLKIMGGPSLRIDLVAKGYDLKGTPVFHPTVGEDWVLIPQRVWFVRFVVKDVRYETGPFVESEVDQIISVLKDPSFWAGPVAQSFANHPAYLVGAVHKGLRVYAAPGDWAEHPSVEAFVTELLSA